MRHRGSVARIRFVAHGFNDAPGIARSLSGFDERFRVRAWGAVEVPTIEGAYDVIATDFAAAGASIAGVAAGATALDGAGCCIIGARAKPAASPENRRLPLCG